MAGESVIYRSPRLYDALMRALYGRNYAARHRALAELVPPGASVLELCPGSGRLWREHLRERAGEYRALDMNPGFVEHLRGLGAEAEVRDLRDPEPLPPADVVLMQASLYHFLPDASPVVERMLAAARERVVIAEPVRNLGTSGNPLLRLASRVFTDPGAGDHADRFTGESLAGLMDRHGDRLEQAFDLPGGRERAYVLSP